MFQNLIYVVIPTQQPKFFILKACQHEVNITFLEPLNQKKIQFFVCNVEFLFPALSGKLYYSEML